LREIDHRWILWDWERRRDGVGYPRQLPSGGVERQNVFTAIAKGADNAAAIGKRIGAAERGIQALVVAEPG